MKFSHFIILLVALPFMFFSCKSEPEIDLFHITIATESEAHVEYNLHEANVTLNGFDAWIDVGIIGNFDSYNLSDDIPDWISIETIPHQENYFRINIASLNGYSRTFNLAFTVFKGNQSQTGMITITQNPNTLEDLKHLEEKAINSYLSKFDIIDNLPPINNIQVGSVAPFYRLDEAGNVYMQVVRMGTEAKASDGDKIYFRFLRYNLLDYYKNGVLPSGSGNANDLSQAPTYFILGSNEPSTLQWGTAIQMPLHLGLPVDSEVNLVVASEAGFTNEINMVIPFLYNIRYYKNAY